MRDHDQVPAIGGVPLQLKDGGQFLPGTKVTHVSVQPEHPCVKRVSVNGQKNNEYPFETATSVVKKLIKIGEGERAKMIAAEEHAYFGLDRGGALHEKTITGGGGLALRRTRKETAASLGPSPVKEAQGDAGSPEPLKVSQVPAYDANGFPLYINPAPTQITNAMPASHGQLLYSNQRIAPRFFQDYKRGKIAQRLEEQRKGGEKVLQTKNREEENCHYLLKMKVNGERIVAKAKRSHLTSSSGPGVIGPPLSAVHRLAHNNEAETEYNDILSSVAGGSVDNTDPTTINLPPFAKEPVSPMPVA